MARPTLDSLSGMRYLVRERLFSITDDFWVTDEQGSKVFLVDGKALRLRETFELKDASGDTLATIRKRRPHHLHRDLPRPDPPRRGTPALAQGTGDAAGASR